MEYNGGSLSADHLCVLVHGLWGNPNHLRSVAKALRAAHPEDELYIRVAERNSGSFTYDGIERGGERVCVEIEEELERIKSKGGCIKKLSVVGYSLGGLVARYAVGLLYANGVFDEVEPVNFTTFATPHLGVRTPLKGWHNTAFNVLGARTLSMSGRQLFLIDDFRGTGRPLLSVLADPSSIFVTGLRRFRRRTLYANVVNDRSVVYYSAAISKTDPFADTERIVARFVPGYENVVLDPTNPVSLRTKPVPAPAPYTRALEYVTRAPLVLALAILIPVGVVVFLANAGVQTVRSARRIKLHETGLAGIEVHRYRAVPLWIRGTVDGVYEELSGAQKQAYLRSATPSVRGAEEEDGEEEEGQGDGEEDRLLALERSKSHPDFPTLALAPCQFEMIASMDAVGWRKFPVWIHHARHSHAAIIVRMEQKRFREGHVIMRHWLEEEFLM
ncbi:DUF676-domain-containing protein [Xylariomycetidae sp. FL0641]|nr:DUF676-domain-containing protein [Xylariomycetidae sp. FL0641]